ncbi:MAG: YkgJ family cysteine cluster protein [Planctomycetota bacterium]|nr:YkgJ family cysteine cluster protein [Planctomycetota bacterium]
MHMHTQAFPELTRLYADLEAEQQRLGAACSGCGACCRFDVADHVLYASDLERRYLLAASGVPAEPDGDPELASLIASGLRCPFQKDGRCEARDGRTLGCRLHFCQWPKEKESEEEAFCEAWHGRLKRLHDDLGLEWRYGPLFPLDIYEKIESIEEKLLDVTRKDSMIVE